jgi:hypothetical protein
MKRINSIRLIFVFCFLLCSAAFAIGYFFMFERPQKIVEIETEPVTDKSAAVPSIPLPNSIESHAKAVDYDFILYEKDGYVVVYEADGITVYSDTDIAFESLNDTLQEEVKNGKPIDTEVELYNFLESHSS